MSFSKPPFFRRSGFSRGGFGALAAALTLSLSLSACSSGDNATPVTPGTSGDLLSAAPGATVKVDITPAAGTTNVSPATPIVVKATGGTLTDVVVTNTGKNKAVVGGMSADKTTWTSSEPLGYGSTYSVDAKGVDPQGQTVEQQGKITTVSPAKQANPNLLPAPSSVAQTGVGVGQIIGFQFTYPVKNKSTVEKQLSVQSKPSQEGGWYWIDDKNVHYRPKQYWQPGTTLTVSAKIYGVDFGNGVYGAEDRTETYRIHDSWIARADGNTDQMQIFHNGQMVKSMPISLGKDSTPTHVGPHVISFKAQKYTMDSCTYGVCQGQPGWYRTDEFWTARIADDGEFVHMNPNSVAAQGNANVSHGCINLNEENAIWFFNTMGLGDVVEVTNSGGPPLPVYDLYGDWELSWEQWQKGSALK